MRLYFTRREVARIVGITPETLRTWERYLPLKLHRRGGKVLYTRRDLDLVILAQKVMKERGVTLRDVARVLETEKLPVQEFRHRREQVEEALRLLQNQLRKLREDLQKALEYRRKERE